MVTLRLTATRVEQTSETEYEDTEAARRVEERYRAARTGKGVESRLTRSGARVRTETSSPVSAAPISLMAFTMSFKF